MHGRQIEPRELPSGYAGNAQYLIETCFAGQHLGRPVLEQRTEPRAPGQRFYAALVFAAAADGIPDLIIDDDRLANHCATEETSATARFAADSLTHVFGVSCSSRRVQAEPLDQSFRIRVRSRTMDAKPAYEPLRHHPGNGRSEQEAFDPEIDQTRNRSDSPVGVQRREYQMARQGGLNRYMCGFQIAYLTDHDDIRILPQD